MLRNKINKNAQAYEVSLNAPIIQTIDQANFDQYMNQVNPTLFNSQEAFTYINLVSAATDFITIVYELITPDGPSIQTFTMRVGNFLPCRGLRILTGTDVSAVINVGVGN